MEEKNVSAKPQAEETDFSATSVGNQTAGEPGEVTIPVKFNKEIKNLNAEEAAVLAQKGMKFEMIENDFERLRSIAAKNKMSVPAYISELEKKQAADRRKELLSECAGNEALADRVMELEDSTEPESDLDEIREYFPTVKSLDDLPRAVVESARLKGENLLNSYLRFRFIKKRQKAQDHLFENAAGKASIGSLRSPEAADDDVFIKALWGK